MAGRFHNPSGTAFMFVLFALAVVRRIDGTPYQSPEYYSDDDGTQPVAIETSNSAGFALSRPDGSRESVQTAAELKTIHYSDSSAAYEDGRGESREFEVSEQERAARHGDEKRTIHEGFDRDSAEDDDDDNNNNNNNNNRENTADEITQLIDDALQDDIFISPKKWAAWLGSSNDGRTPAKVQKPRSPTASHNVVTHKTIHQTQDDRIVFPNEYPSKIPDNSADKPVPSCVNSTYCLEPPYYPSDVDVDNALKLRYLDPISEPSTISERMGPLDEGNGLCPSMTDTIFPKTAVGDNNQWYYVLNNEKYVQSVRVERCQTENKPCSLIEGFSSGYKTTCKQKYVYRQLVAIDSGRGEPAAKPFPMPSSCCCQVKFTGEPEMRLGVSPAKSNRQSPAP